MPDTIRHDPDTVQTPPDTMEVFTHKPALEETVSKYHPDTRRYHPDTPRHRRVFIIEGTGRKGNISEYHALINFCQRVCIGSSPGTTQTPQAPPDKDVFMQ